MSSPSDIERFADQHGVDFSVERGASGWSIECWSPVGKLWRSTGTHFLALPGDGSYTMPDWKQVKKVLQDEVAYGFEDCTDDDCEVCCE